MLGGKFDFNGLGGQSAIIYGLLRVGVTLPILVITGVLLPPLPSLVLMGAVLDEIIM
jgi:hypothetical protein